MADRPSDAAKAEPILTPGEIQGREEAALAPLPRPDQEDITRSAAEGMVGTVAEAATVPTEHVTGSAEVHSAATPSPIVVSVDLQVVPPAWAGTLWPSSSTTTLAVPGQYWVQLADGRRGLITVTHQLSGRYTFEGVGELTQRPNS